VAQPAHPKQVIVYADPHGQEPFTEWLAALRDTKGRQRIQTRIRRLEQGLYGDCKPVGEGVSELRMFFGPGYRVYFGEDPEHVVILLCGGDKSTQDKDIEQAQAYWKEYRGHERT